MKYIVFSNYKCFSGYCFGCGFNVIHECPVECLKVFPKPDPDNEG